MRPRSLIAFIGFIFIIGGTYCPLLRPFHLLNWDLYALNKPYGIVVFITAIAGLAAVVAGQRAAAKAVAWVSLTLIVLVYIAAVIKVNTSFSFIPFKGISAGLAKLIKFKWGWWVLVAGALLTLTGSSGRKKVFYKPAVNKQ